MKIESQYTIKNCPFCNSQGNLYKLGSRAYVVRCENPACKAEQVVFSCEEAAVQMWNKRPVKPERPIIDKIRAEIEQKIEQERFARSVFRGEEKDAVKAEQCTGSIFAYNNVIKLIDKYKAEQGAGE